MTIRCNTCGRKYTDRKTLQVCGAEIPAPAGWIGKYQIKHCKGVLSPAHYNVFDLGTRKYMKKAALSGDSMPAREWGTPFQDYAGVFDDDELERLLSLWYGTTDRDLLARKCTILRV